MTLFRTIIVFVLVGIPTAHADPKDARCKPSCYEPEAESPDSGKEVKACAHWTKGFCETATLSGWSEPELNQGASFVGIVSDCKFPKANAGKWAKLSKQAAAVLEPKKGDVAFIPASSTWDDADSSDGSKLRCLDLHWYEKESSVTMTKCGHPDQAVVCEVSGSKSVRAINMIHYRLDEAKKLKDTDKDGCQAAALQAIAFSRGLPKFKKNLGDDWAGGLTYRTRYDGTLKEKALFAQVKKLGDDATKVYKACGGGTPKTTDEDEMAFRN
jgi:hypothetical protein